MEELFVILDETFFISYYQRRVIDFNQQKKNYLIKYRSKNLHLK